MRPKSERLGKLESSLKLDTLEAGPNNHRKPILVKDSIPDRKLFVAPAAQRFLARAVFPAAVTKRANVRRNMVSWPTLDTALPICLNH